MSDASVSELQKELERVRGKLHAIVQGDVNLLLDEKTYSISTELDKLIVRLMKKEAKMD